MAKLLYACQCALLFYYVLCAKSTHALSPKQWGDIVNVREHRINNGQWYGVPKGKCWMLQDIRKYHEDRWVEVEGTLQFMKDYRDLTGPSYLISGKFTFTASDHDEHLSWVLVGGSRLKLHTIKDLTVGDIYEFEYSAKESACPRQ